MIDLYYILTVEAAPRRPNKFLDLSEGYMNS